MKNPKPQGKRTFLLASLLLFSIFINQQAKAGSKTEDSTNYTKNYLKFSPLSFIPYNMMPCFAVDFEHRHSNIFSSQVTAGLYISNNADLNTFPGFKTAYEGRLYLTKKESLRAYISLNWTFISQTGMEDLTFVNVSTSNSLPDSRYSERVKVHRDIILNSFRFGLQFPIGKRLAIDAFMAAGVMIGHNIHYGRSNPEDPIIESDILPIPNTLKSGDFSSITFPYNIKLCYKLN
jgi:hypothetical protein